MTFHVEAVTREYIASGLTFDEILHDFPFLTREDITAALTFAAVVTGSDMLVPDEIEVRI